MGSRDNLYQSRLQFLTRITIVGILILTSLRAIDPVTLERNGCPEWLCLTPQIPQLSFSLLDLAYLLLAIISVVLSVITARLVWSKRDQYLSFLPLVATGAVVLGGATLLCTALLLVDGANFFAKSLFVTATLIYLAMVLIIGAIVHSTLFSFTYSPQKMQSSLSLLIIGTAILFFLTIVTGVFVTEFGAAKSCPDWPLCRGQLLPLLEGDIGLAFNLFHRLSVIVLSLLVATIVLKVCRDYSKTVLVNQTAILGLLFLSQVAVGGWYALEPVSRIFVDATHIVLTATIWGSLIVAATTFYVFIPLKQSVSVTTPKLSFREKSKVYFKLTKPWIMILLLVTTVGAMFIADKGLPSVGLIFVTMLGGALAAGGASVLNSYVDSDIDQLMSRTSRRATVTGLVTPTETLIFGLVLSTISFFVYAFFVNTMSAALSTLGILYYVFFYTLYLKRSTIHNIIIGGAAGAIPPLVGWTAVTGALDLGAFYLFAIIFFWTPPHTWALAILVKKDYAQARVPMLPVVVGERETTYQIFLYTILLITLTLLPVTFNMLSAFYFFAALALGIPFIYLAWKLWRNHTSKQYSKRLYKFSQLYLALLFLVMAIDRSFFLVG